MPGLSGYKGFGADMEKGTTHLQPSIKNDEKTFRGAHKGKGGTVGAPSNLGGGSFPSSPAGNLRKKLRK